MPMTVSTHGRQHAALIHIAKRDSIHPLKAALIRVAAIILALLVCAVVINSVTGLNPLKVYMGVIDGAMGTPRRTWVTIRDALVLLCVAIGLTPAFKMHFWNIGAEGQILVGAIASAALMINASTLPGWLLLPLMFLASMIAGMIWGVIPAFFKAHWNTNETLFTLMMNYIAMCIVSYFSYEWSVPKGSGHIGVINDATEAGWLPSIGGKAYLCNILVVAALTAFMYVYLKYSKHGYEISVVGESENTAKYIGINVKKVILRTMLLSGALCGIAGFLLVSGTDHTVNRDTAGGRGFTAIMVSWLAKFDPLYMILTSLLIVFLQRGAGEISTSFGLNDSFSEIITGIIIFFIIGSEFFVNYQLKFREKEANK